MFKKYKRNGLIKCLSIKKSTKSYCEFVNEMEFSDLIPFSRNNRLGDYHEKYQMYLLEATYNDNISVDFFAKLLIELFKNNKIYVYNYKYTLDDYKKYGSNNYQGEIINFGIDEKRTSKTILELNESLIDEQADIDWYKIWGHGFEAWIIKKEHIERFKEITKRKEKLSCFDTLMSAFVCKVEYASLHESIRFISNDKLIINNIENYLNRIEKCNLQNHF